MSKLLELAERITARSKRVGSGCLEWQGALNDRGYGQIGVGGRVKYVHRLAYEIANGPIPEGLQIDHLCRNRRCCEPSHLEAVTPRENTRRGDAGLHRKLWAKALATCPQGHSYDAENTYVSKAGKRHCKSCAIDRQNARRAKMKEAGIVRTA